MHLYCKSFLMTAIATVVSIQFAAARTTPIEAFIRHEMEVRDFVPVNDIWQADKDFDKTLLLTKVEDVLPLTIDYNRLSGFMKEKNKDIDLVIPKTRRWYLYHKTG